MVSVTGICGTLITLCATLNNVPTEEVVAQISYETVDSKEQMVELLEDEVSDLYAPRDLLSSEVLDVFQNYLEYQQELEQQRIAEEQARIEKERQRALEQQYTHKDYRQTYYSVQEGERNLGAGYNVNSSEIEVINNIMNFYDNEYGYLPIVAININEVLDSGLNAQGTPNLYGSVIEIKYPNEDTQKAIVLDACGACSRASKIDLWVYNNAPSLDISGIEFKYVRKGW